jgi:hypothetical protein
MAATSPTTPLGATRAGLAEAAQDAPLYVPALFHPARPPPVTPPAGPGPAPAARELGREHRRDVSRVRAVHVDDRRGDARVDAPWSPPQGRTGPTVHVGLTPGDLRDSDGPGPEGKHGDVEAERPVDGQRQGDDAEQAGDGAATPRSRREWAGRVADTRANRATDSRDAVDDPYASDNGSERKR